MARKIDKTGFGSKQDFLEYNKGKEDCNRLFFSKKTQAIFEPTYHAVRKIYELGHKRNPTILKDFDKAFPKGLVKIKITNEDRLKTLALFSITYPIHIAYEPNYKKMDRVKLWLDICERLVESASFK